METYDFRCTLYFQSFLYFPSSALSPQLRFATATWASRLDSLFPMLFLFFAIFGDTWFAIPLYRFRLYFHFPCIASLEGFPLPAPLAGA